MAAGTLYATYQNRTAPGCLQRANGVILERDFGAEKDVAMDRAVQGVKASLPGYGPDDALDYQAAERDLPRGVGENNAALRERMRTCFDSPVGPAFAGSDGGILNALARAGFPTGLAAGAVIVKRSKTHSYLNAGVVTYGTHPQMTFDASPPSIWNQFLIVFGADFTPPIGTTFQDGDPSANLLNDLVRKWKPSKWTYLGCSVIVSGPVWGWPPGAVWDGLGLDWGSGVVRFVSPP